MLKAEFIFLLPMVFKTAWFYFFKKDYTLEELQNYMPLSLESLFGYENFEPWYIYPLQTAVHSHGTTCRQTYLLSLYISTPIAIFANTKLRV